MSTDNLRQILETKISELKERKRVWNEREIHAAWNPDGKGGHIKASVMMDRIDYAIKIIQEELIPLCK